MGFIRFCYSTSTVEVLLESTSKYNFDVADLLAYFEKNKYKCVYNMRWRVEKKIHANYNLIFLLVIYGKSSITDQDSREKIIIVIRHIGN